MTEKKQYGSILKACGR